MLQKSLLYACVNPFVGKLLIDMINALADDADEENTTTTNIDHHPKTTISTFEL